VTGSRDILKLKCEEFEWSKSCIVMKLFSHGISITFSDTLCDYGLIRVAEKLRIGCASVFLMGLGWLEPKF